MSRGLWFVAGAGAGVYAMIRGRRAAEALTVDGLRDRVGAAVVGARMFRDEVAQGKAEAETDLRQRTGLGPHGAHELGVAASSTNQRGRSTHEVDPLHQDKEGTS
ncbi:hypothetical protein NPS01_21650 [Nocardioides psychrotolerans]|uniref:Uncharacterized protein n=1 Tax=Nocardioides psychrotolerans TaxID=1005945 RepID=A0A1I3KKN8_9ACTN|nr:DUF6167 family protein [Nocardioides psychrotolerans]GEP38502.1 hypothetical protein NPS01_21650 [Nocardioides psychrotolerans]SFI72888.1 hypothetical protein SAMN05216561_11270 [Nocardioides psychrotolerans]